MNKFNTNGFIKERCLCCGTYQYFEEIDDIVCCPHCDSYLLMESAIESEWIENPNFEDCQDDYDCGYWDAYTYFYLEKIIYANV